MTAHPKKTKKDSLVMFVAIAFIVGFVSGAAFAVFKLGPSSPAPTASAPQQQSQTNMSDQQQRAIANLEQDVTSNPDKFQSWTQLGNLYFDTGQYDKAVKAYEKSLELHAGNADIWTDLGVMYRRTNRPSKAIESFDKAMNMNPQHTTSRLNKGIVLLYDFSDTEGAIQAWEDLLRINPEAKAVDGSSIRDIIAQLKSNQAGQQ